MSVPISMRYGSLLAAVAVALVAPALAQQPKALRSADVDAGKVLVERDCVACHQRIFGDATKTYTRADRKVGTSEQLLAQVQRCNAELKAGYFPDDEEHVAAYLDFRYYKFTK